jgi:hypothetical protein
MLGFPYGEVLNMVEFLAMQADKGSDARGRKITAAFKATSFEVERGPLGEPVLSLVIDESGKISDLLPMPMVAQLPRDIPRSIRCLDGLILPAR